MHTHNVYIIANVSCTNVCVYCYFMTPLQTLKGCHDGILHLLCVCVMECGPTHWWSPDQKGVYMCACLWSFWTERALGQSWGTRGEWGAVGSPCTGAGAGSPCMEEGGSVEYIHVYPPPQHTHTHNEHVLYVYMHAACHFSHTVTELNT